MRSCHRNVDWPACDVIRTRQRRFFLRNMAEAPESQREDAALPPSSALSAPPDLSAVEVAAGQEESVEVKVEVPGVEVGREK